MSRKELSQIYVGRQSKLVDLKISKDISSLMKKEFPQLFCTRIWILSSLGEKRKKNNTTTQPWANFLSHTEQKLRVQVVRRGWQFLVVALKLSKWNFRAKNFISTHTLLIGYFKSSLSDSSVFGRYFAEQCRTPPDTTEEVAVTAKKTLYQKDKGGNLGCTQTTLIKILQ